LTDFKSLDPEIRRIVDHIGELDGKAQSAMDEIERLGQEFFKSSSEATAAQKKEQVDKIQVSALNSRLCIFYTNTDLLKYPYLYSFLLQKLQEKAKEYADDKVNLADQAVALVDKHLLKLSSDMCVLEAAINTGQAHFPLKRMGELILKPND